MLQILGIVSWLAYGFYYLLLAAFVVFVVIPALIWAWLLPYTFFQRVWYMRSAGAWLSTTRCVLAGCALIHTGLCGEIRRR